MLERSKRNIVARERISGMVRSRSCQKTGNSREIGKLAHYSDITLTQSMHAV